MPVTVAMTNANSHSRLLPFEENRSSLEGLAGAERALMEKWNDTGVAYPADVRLHELFERQVRNTPNAVAVVFNESSLKVEGATSCNLKRSE